MEKQLPYDTAWDLHDYILNHSDSSKVLMRTEKKYIETVSDALLGEKISSSEELKKRLKEEKITPFYYIKTLVELTNSYMEMIREVLEFVEGEHMGDSSLKVALQQNEKINELFEKFKSIDSTYLEQDKKPLRLSNFKELQSLMKNFNGNDEQYSKYNFTSKHYKDSLTAGESLYVSLNIEGEPHKADNIFEHLLNFIISSLEDADIAPQGQIKSAKHPLAKSINDLILGNRISGYKNASSAVKHEFLKKIESYINSSVQRILDFPFWKDRTKLYEIWCLIKLIKTFKEKRYPVELLKDGWDQGMKDSSKLQPINIKVFKNGKPQIISVFYEPTILVDKTPDIVIKDEEGEIIQIIEAKDSKKFDRGKMREVRKKYQFARYPLMVVNHVDTKMPSCADYQNEVAPSKNIIGFERVVEALTKKGFHPYNSILLLDISSSMKGTYTKEFITELNNKRPDCVYTFSSRGIEPITIDNLVFPFETDNNDLDEDKLKAFCSEQINSCIEIVSDKVEFTKLSRM